MAVDITDQVITRRLVTVANSKAGYEDVAGSLVAITGADDVDTTEQLVMFEAFQKVIVVNGTVLRVADFINTRIDLGVGNELTSPPAKGDVLTQDQTGGDYADMIVDFVDSTLRYIYGYATYRGSATEFDTTNDFVSNDAIATMDATGSDSIPDVVAEASTMPHWYEYTTYPDIVLAVARYGLAIGATKKFGILPEDGVFPAKAYLGCLYRGRAVLSGNPNYPHQWYLSRQADIWDYAYTANDAQSPVVGNNADAGEIGDIITCLVPYKDDYLIFGMANSIYVLRGDPAKGGDLDPVDLTVGIFGANSWCFDGDGNLYFWGTNGIYIMPAGFGAVKCLTENTIPNIVADEDVNPTTHRITMGYDRKRRGILVCITVLTTGVNSNYWYDLRTGGFAPENYPNQCGPYSLFYYAANDKDYADLLVGCKDGYVRKFDDTAKDDNTGPGVAAIDSYCALPIQPLSPDGDHEGATVAWADDLVSVIGDLVIHSSVEYRCIVGHTADIGGPPHEAPDTNTTDWETVAQESGTLTGVGRKERLRHRLRGAYLGIKLGNSSTDKSWAVEAVAGEVVPAGKIK